MSDEKDQDVIVDHSEYVDADDDFLDVPELELPSTLPSNYEMKVETDILEPVVFSQQFARFTLQKKGFLSHQSKIAFAVNPADGVINDGAFYPLNIGVNSLISRCVLKAGQKTIAETDSFNFLQAYRSAFITNENNYDREQYVTGRMINFNGEYVYLSTQGNPDVSAPHYGIRTGMELTFNALGLDSRKLQPFALIDGTNAARRSETPVFSIFLADLFDVFTGYDLPLFMCEEEIHIELHFMQETHNRVSVQDGDASNQIYNIVQDECRMIYDTIYYDGETMERYRKKKDAKDGVVLDYVDYRLNTRVVTQAEINAGIIQNIGGAGRLVDKVIWGINIGSNGAGDDQLLTNCYNSSAPTLTAGAVKEVEASVNLFYNDRFEFSVDRDNLAVLFDTTARANGGLPLQLSKQFYGNESANVVTASGVEGRVENASFSGKNWWNAIKLMRGERINNQGIDFKFKHNTALASTTIMIWLALKKTAVLHHGRFDCYFQ